MTQRDVIVINSLKEASIERFEYFLNKLFKGYKLDYSDIINMICLIELYKELGNSSMYYASKYI